MEVIMLIMLSAGRLMLSAGFSAGRPADWLSARLASVSDAGGAVAAGGAVRGGAAAGGGAYEEDSGGGAGGIGGANGMGGSGPP